MGTTQREQHHYRQIAAALADPGFYPHAPDEVTLHETHTSCVFVAGDLVYKLKKPVSLGFLDYSTVARRLAMCREEVRLNRRLAPSIYLGVRSVVEREGGLALGDEDDPEAIDHLVEMRRYEERLTLASALSRGAAGAEEIHGVAARLADFHASAPVAAPPGDPRAPLKRTSDQTLASLLALAPASLQAEVAAAQRFSNAFLVARRDTFEARAGDGRVREVHGDARAEHVLLSDPIEIVDCVEFDPALREIDVGYDLAFLAMDLEFQGAPDLARTLVEAYRERDGDPGDDGLVAFFGAHRAWVRANVALVRERQRAEAGEQDSRSETAVERLLALGHRLAWRARRPLVLVVCGLSGSGKSHLAGALSEVSGVGVIASDEVRKGLAGVDPMDRAPADAYRPDAGVRTYAELGRRAAEQLDRDGTAIVDATFRLAADRDAFASAAGAAAASTRFVECVAPEPVRLSRVEERVHDVSDADVEIARAQAFEPLDEVPAPRHLTLRTDQPAADAVAVLEAWLDVAEIGSAMRT